MVRIRTSAFLVSLVLLAAFVEMSPGISALPDDLHLASVEVVQVVPNPPALIVNKSGALCVHVESTFSSRVYADIEVTYNFERGHYVEKGPSGTGVPIDPGLNKVFIPGGNCTAYRAGWWTYPLTLIWDMTGTDLNIKAKVDPDNRIAETDETNNLETTSGGVDVELALPIKVLIMPVNVNVDDILESHIHANMRFMRDIYPVADDGLMYSIHAKITNVYIMQGHSPIEYAYEYAEMARELGYDRAVILADGNWGWGGVACGMLQIPEDRTPVVVVKDSIMAKDDLIAHEIGHTYYLWHPHDIGIPVNACTRYWTYQRDQDNPASTFMSYRSQLPVGIPRLIRWIDDQRYCTYPKSWIDLTGYEDIEVDGVWEWDLYQQFVLRLPDLRRVVHLCGTIFSNGTLTLGKSWQVLPEGLPDLMPTAGAPQPSDYRIVFRDLSGTVLASMGFNASFKRSIPLDETDDYYKDEWSEIPFSFNLPHYDGIRTVQVVNSTGAVSVQRTVSTTGPSVRLFSPVGGEVRSIGGRIPVSWNGTDPDSEDITYIVAYSTDDGICWNPIASGITQNTTEWNTSGLLPGASYKIKVIASDGFNSAETSSGHFALYDSTAPTTTASLQGERSRSGWYLSQVNVTLGATDNSRLNRTEYSLDGSSWASYVSQIEFPSEGAKRMYFRSTDYAGNVEEAKVCEFGIDLQAPSVRFVTPNQGETMQTGEINLTWVCNDTASGISKCEISVNNGTWIDVGTSSSHLLSNLTKGDVKVDLKVHDFAGYENTTSVAFRYEPEPSRGISTLALFALGAAIVGGACGLGYILLRRARPKAP